MRETSRRQRLGRATVKLVHAPAPFLPPSTPLPLNRVVSVLLEAGERVAWIWTYDPSGASYVSGYTIVKGQLRRRKIRKDLRRIAA